MARSFDGSESPLCFWTYVVSTQRRESMKRSSSVGVIYRMSVMRKSGTWRTWFSIKVSPVMILSSHVTWSKAKMKEENQRRMRTP